jgi:hypothetical protein
LIQFEVEEIGRTIEMEKLAAKTSWKTLVQTPGNRKRTFIAICVGAFAQYNVRSISTRDAIKLVRILMLSI